MLHASIRSVSSPKKNGACLWLQGGRGTTKRVSPRKSGLTHPSEGHPSRCHPIEGDRLLAALTPLARGTRLGVRRLGVIRLGVIRLGVTRFGVTRFGVRRLVTQLR